MTNDIISKLTIELGERSRFHLSDIRQYEHFAADLPMSLSSQAYCLLNDYEGSTSEHPLDDVRLGEGLIIC